MLINSSKLSSFNSFQKVFAEFNMSPESTILSSKNELGILITNQDFISQVENV